MVCSLFYVSTCFSYETCLLRLPLGKPWVVRTHQSAAKDSSWIGPEQAKVGLSKIALCFMTSIKPSHVIFPKATKPELTSMLSTSASTFQDWLRES